MRWQRPGDTGSSPDDARMTLTEHLRELRRRVIIASAAIVVGTIVAFVFRHWILHRVAAPFCALPPSCRAIQVPCSLVAFGVLDAFNVTRKLSLYAGLLLSSPVWL